MEFLEENVVVTTNEIKDQTGESKTRQKKANNALDGNYWSLPSETSRLRTRRRQFLEDPVTAILNSVGEEQKADLQPSLSLPEKTQQLKKRKIEVKKPKAPAKTAEPSPPDPKKTSLTSRRKGISIKKDITPLMDGWSEARKSAYEQIESNPNMYYYRFNAPGEDQKNGPWTAAEKALFLKRIEECGVDRWGYFSMAIPGRVGYQCANYYRKLLKEGEIDGSAHPIKRRGVNRNKGDDEVTAPKKSKRKISPSEAPTSTPSNDVAVQPDGTKIRIKLGMPWTKSAEVKTSVLANSGPPAKSKGTAKKGRKMSKCIQPVVPAVDKKAMQAEKKIKDKEDKRIRQELQQKKLEEDVLGKLVTEGLYLGNCRVAQNDDWIKSANVTHILNMTKEVKNFYEQDSTLTYKRVAVADSMDTNLMPLFPECFQFIQGALSQGQAVLVHCNEGRSRSVSVILGYLIHTLGWTLANAYAKLNQVSDNVNVNDGFKRQLMELEKQKTGSSINTINFFESRRSSGGIPRPPPPPPPKRSPRTKKATQVQAITEPEAPSEAPALQVELFPVSKVETVALCDVSSPAAVDVSSPITSSSPEHDPFSPEMDMLFLGGMEEVMMSEESVNTSLDAEIDNWLLVN